MRDAPRRDPTPAELRKLSDAILHGDVDVVRDHLAGGGDPDARERGTTLLMEACSLKQLEIAKLLVAKGADVNARNDSHQLPLTFALEYPDVGSRDVARDLTVVRALVTLLLDAGAAPNPPKDARPRPDAALMFAPPLTRAAELGDPAVVELLLARGADVHGTDHRGYPALIEAINCGHVAVVAKLIEAGADVNPKNPPRAGVPLAQAVSQQGSALGMFVHEATHVGKTPDAERLEGMRENAVALVTLLVKAGALLEARDERGWTPLVEAVNSGAVVLVETLVALGSDVDAKDANGTSVLHFLAELRRLDEGGLVPVAAALAKTKADRSARDANGLTPAQVAAKRGFPKLAAALAP